MLQLAFKINPCISWVAQALFSQTSLKPGCCQASSRLFWWLPICKSFIKNLYTSFCSYQCEKWKHLMKTVIGLTPLKKSVCKRRLNCSFLCWWIVVPLEISCAQTLDQGRMLLHALLSDMSAQCSEVFWDILVSSLCNCTTSLSEIMSQGT